MDGSHKESDSIIKLVQKENETLRRAMKDKNVDNGAITSLVDLLEIQRDRINFLEEGKTPLNSSF